MSQEKQGGGIAVIGDRESVMLFRVLGLETFPAETAEEAARAINKLAREGCSIIYITEGLARMVPEELARYQARTCPAIIPIPGSKGADGFGREQIQSNIYKAVGMDLQ